MRAREGDLILTVMIGGAGDQMPADILFMADSAHYFIIKVPNGAIGDLVDHYRQPYHDQDSADNPFKWHGFPSV